MVVTSQLSNRNRNFFLLNEAVQVFYSASIESDLFFKFGLKNINYL